MPFYTSINKRGSEKYKTNNIKEKPNHSYHHSWHIQAAYNAVLRNLATPRRIKQLTTLCQPFKSQKVPLNLISSRIMQKEITKVLNIGIAIEGPIRCVVSPLITRMAPVFCLSIHFTTAHLPIKYTP